MAVVDGLAPIWRQGILNNHDNVGIFNGREENSELDLYLSGEISFSLNGYQGTSRFYDSV